MITNTNGKVSISSVSSENLAAIAEGTTSLQNQINALDTLVNGVTLRKYDGTTTTMSAIMTNINYPIIMLLTTENVSDKPSGKYGTIIVFKVNNTRCGAVCLTTDGKLYTMGYSVSGSTATLTGWIEK